LIYTCIIGFEDDLLEKFQRFFERKSISKEELKDVFSLDIDKAPSPYGSSLTFTSRHEAL
jgi:hypothetical protein